MKRLAALVLALCLGATVTACKAPAKPVEDNPPIAVSTAKTTSVTIVFPAYELDNPAGKYDIEQINATPKFSLTAELPEGWEITDTHKGEAVPMGNFYTPMYLYSGEELMGYVGFNRFEPYEREIDQSDYYKTVYQYLRLSSMFRWDPYTSVKESDTGESGVAEVSYVDPEQIDNYPGAMSEVPVLETVGVLSYDKALQVYIGIAFMPDTVYRQQAVDIAKSVQLKAVD